MNVVIKILEKKVFKKLGKDKININLENFYFEKVLVYKNGKVVKYKI